MDKATDIKAPKPREAMDWPVRIALLIFDAFLGGLTMLLVIRWRYDFLNKSLDTNVDWHAAILSFASVIFIWTVMRMDRAIWRFTSLKDIRGLLVGVIIVSALTPLLLFFFFERGINFPRSAPFTGGAFFFGLLLLTRLMAMVIQNGDIRALFRATAKHTQDAILVGPSSKLYNYLRDSSRGSDVGAVNPIGLIETTGANIGRSIRGYPVLGGLEDLKDVYQRIVDLRDRPLKFISIDPNLSRPETAHLVKVTAEIGAPLSRFQTEGPSNVLTSFEASDLIGRDLQDLDISPVRRLIKGRRVLVTGAGGSIGSEISRQIAPFNPASLALFDSSEYNLYELQHSLAPFKPLARDPDWTTYIGDVCDPGRLDEVFEWERPEIVIHAAAMKHVPIGERNPIETLRTNVFGTQKVIEACAAHKVANFILISTDKAVSPVNIMGASKRVVEMLMVAMAGRIPDLNMAAVRFGNVLASRGSVVPLFEKQIAAGGPVTVTHRDVTRYFMTTEEAAALVLQAAALEDPDAPNHSQNEADIYVLEMGEPVNIARLARQLIRLRGKVPDKDIEIRFTGLRAGEKICETLTGQAENLAPTPVQGIQRFTGEIADPDIVISSVETLLKAIEERDRLKVCKALKELLPNFEATETLTQKL